jgi:hypothetical protein
VGNVGRLLPSYVITNGHKALATHAEAIAAEQGAKVVGMASRGKKKTTFAKLARESRLRERRIDKQARKEARKQASEVQTSQGDAGANTVGDER